ncbi:MAG: gamma-glutamyltransferase, partial [Ekhidna sp.]|nr:gamma-glutamyltransferase [Ekhidna sp.]
MRIIKFFAMAVLAYACTTAPQKPQSEPKEPETGPLGESAMISSAHPLATKAGVEILKNGGNAIDAAVAVKFALAVVFPRAGNLGGGGFCVFRMNDGSVGSIDFREKAPLNATRDMYLDG